MTIKRRRMSERIHQILSQLLLREVSDPRLQDITVTEVSLDPELMVAKVYVSAMGDEDREPDVMRGLGRAGGFLRREVGKRIRLRNTPELHFYWDSTLARADRINSIISNLDIPAEVADDERADNSAAR
ncbi:MAG: 30S ribosome-binding factor RbfA [Chloroflexota bacterium]|nr:30S ribosome-binding factor RbfA [Chloroflexota bacterium]MDE2947213.1 30S ribosome-binding factor RbfA [Chloroflexota bacterium]